MTLEAEGFAGYPLLWHCFGQGPDTARRILRNGWHISIPGPVTYKANDALREAVALIPADRLLLETDAPYLAPMPWRGKRNEPAFTVFTVRAMLPAELLRKSPPRLPECSELDVVRHFTQLSQLNYSVDANFYPLGSCTM